MSDEVKLLDLTTNQVTDKFIKLRGIHLNNIVWTDNENDLATLLIPDGYELVVKKVNRQIGVYRRKLNVR